MPIVGKIAEQISECMDSDSIEVSNAWHMERATAIQSRLARSSHVIDRCYSYEYPSSIQRYHRGLRCVAFQV